ncbi:MAG: hypothetical protein KAG53_09860 [Endozoicomonadaceae bacterium]|nr:hypothetical protein [Endozoicomonadaceae bacterium]
MDIYENKILLGLSNISFTKVKPQIMIDNLYDHALRRFITNRFKVRDYSDFGKSDKRYHVPSNKDDRNKVSRG